MSSKASTSPFCARPMRVRLDSSPLQLACNGIVDFLSADCLDIRFQRMMPPDTPGFKLARLTPSGGSLSDLREQLQETLGSAYTLERELGGGGMSRVFVAEETRLDRKVVIKVLLPAFGAAVNLERFKREIQQAAKLQHPNIVAVMESGATEKLPYYTMPFVEG